MTAPAETALVDRLVAGLERYQARLQRADHGVKVHALLHGMLGLLLFAGALHLDVERLGTDKLAVAALALGGTALSTLTAGGDRQRGVRKEALRQSERRRAAGPDW